jgi:hypothetical protein
MGPSLRIPGVPTFPAGSRSGILGIRRIPEDEVGPEWNPNPEFTSSSSSTSDIYQVKDARIGHIMELREWGVNGHVNSTKEYMRFFL